MVDKANVYLSALQRGYRVENYSLTTVGGGVSLIVAPFNPNRVLLYLTSTNPGDVELQFKLESGFLVQYIPDLTLNHGLWTVALHYSVPSFEVIHTNVGVHTITGFGLIKN